MILIAILVGVAVGVLATLIWAEIKITKIIEAWVRHYEEVTVRRDK